MRYLSARASAHEGPGRGLFGKKGPVLRPEPRSRCRGRVSHVVLMARGGVGPGPPAGADPKPCSRLGSATEGPYYGPNRGRVIGVARTVRLGWSVRDAAWG